jgi:hypothetical protein
MQPHQFEGRRPDPEDDDKKRNTLTVWLVVITAGLLAAITIRMLDLL